MQYFLFKILIIITFFNGILVKLVGNLMSEGLILILAFASFFFSRKLELKQINLFLVMLLYFIITKDIIILSFEKDFLRIIFAFPFLFIIILCFSKNVKYVENIDKICKLIIYCACISYLVAIMQRFGFISFLPLEGQLRATGLSRSSLNLTGILFAALSIVLLQNHSKIYLQNLITLSIIFCGLIAAGGRGGIFAAILLIIVKFLFLIKKNWLKRIFFLFSLTILALMAGEYFLRTFSAFNFQTDQSNLDRLESYTLFFKHITIFGAGIGQAAPSARHLIDVIGFESTLLNIIYELGIFWFTVIFFFFLLKISTNDKNQNIRLLTLLFCAAPIYIGQQLYQGPSAFVAIIIIIDILMTKRDIKKNVETTN